MDGLAERHILKMNNPTVFESITFINKMLPTLKLLEP